MTETYDNSFFYAQLSALRRVHGLVDADIKSRESFVVKFHDEWVVLDTETTNKETLRAAIKDTLKDLELYIELKGVEPDEMKDDIFSFIKFFKNNYSSFLGKNTIAALSEYSIAIMKQKRAQEGAQLFVGRAGPKKFNTKAIKASPVTPRFCKRCGTILTKERAEQTCVYHVPEITKNTLFQAVYGLPYLPLDEDDYSRALKELVQQRTGMKYSGTAFNENTGTWYDTKGPVIVLFWRYVYRELHDVQRLFEEFNQRFAYLDRSNKSTTVKREILANFLEKVLDNFATYSPELQEFFQSEVRLNQYDDRQQLKSLEKISPEVALFTRYPTYQKMVLRYITGQDISRKETERAVEFVDENFGGKTINSFLYNTITQWLEQVYSYFLNNEINVYPIAVYEQSWAKYRTKQQVDGVVFKTFVHEDGTLMGRHTTITNQPTFLTYQISSTNGKITLNTPTTGLYDTPLYKSLEFIEEFVYERNRIGFDEKKDVVDFVNVLHDYIRQYNIRLLKMLGFDTTFYETLWQREVRGDGVEYALEVGLFVKWIPEKQRQTELANEIRTTNRLIKQTNVDLVRTKAQIERKRGRIQEIDQLIDRFNTTIADNIQELEQIDEQEQKTSTERLRLTTERVIVRNTLRGFAGQIDRKEEEIKATEEEQATAQNELDTINKKGKFSVDDRDRIDELEQIIGNTVTRLETLRQQKGQLTAEKTQPQEELARLERQDNELEAKRKRLVDRKELLETENNRLELEKLVRFQEKEDAENAIDEFIKSITALQLKLMELEDTLQRLQTEKRAGV